MNSEKGTKIKNDYFRGKKPKIKEIRTLQIEKKHNSLALTVIHSIVSSVLFSF
jgi:hypothetical protein